MTHLLLVDDDTSFLNALVAKLGDYSVMKASSGVEALFQCQSHQVDLIITNVELADLSGLNIIHMASLIRGEMRGILLSTDPPTSTPLIIGGCMVISKIGIFHAIEEAIRRALASPPCIKDDALLDRIKKIQETIRLKFGKTFE